MNYKQLEALIYVHQHGTFKQAAESLYFDSSGEEYITPESIQYRIKQLEQELGVSLYRKRQGSSRVLLTREGQLFLREAIDVYQRMTEWKGMFLESQRGQLTIASTQAVILHRLLDPVREFLARHPRVRLRVINAPAQEMEAMVAEGRVDFAISTRPPEAAELEYVLWRRTPMALITPVGHPLTRIREPQLKDIVDFPLILLEPEIRGDRELVDEAFRQAGIHQINLVLECSNSEIIKCYVEAGLGVSVIAETSTQPLRRKIEVIPLGRQVGKTEVGLLLRQGQYLTLAAREFIQRIDPDLAARVAAPEKREAPGKRAAAAAAPAASTSPTSRDKGEGGAAPPAAAPAGSGRKGSQR